MITPSPSRSDYLTHVYVPARLDISRGCVGQYHYAITLFERWAERTLTLADLDEDSIRRWLADYKAGGAAPKTVNNKRQAILSLWFDGYEQGYLDWPPRARETPRVPEAWSPEEVGRLLTAAGEIFGDDWKGLYLRAFILVLYDTGARPVEVLRLNNGDLDISRGIVVFRTKTGAIRLARLHPDTCGACRELQRVLGSGQPLRWPMSRSWLRECFLRCVWRAGLRHGRDKGGVLYKLRRSSGSIVEANGGEGHKHLGNSRAVFERHYRDPRMLTDTLQYLPRPIEPGG